MNFVRADVGEATDIRRCRIFSLCNSTGYGFNKLFGRYAYLAYVTAFHKDTLLGRVT